MTFIYQQFLFYIAIILVLFIPGYFLLLAIESKKKLFNSFERFIFSLGFSLVIVTFLMILIGKVGILLNRLSVILGILIFSAICLIIHKIEHYIIFSRSLNNDTGIKKLEADENDKAFNFSKNQKIIIIILLFLTILIKTAYLKNSIFPTSTDLGHHMYWSKIISETGKLPLYQERDILNTDGNYQISQPENIADFIIGEHLIFSAINLISGVDFISYFPSLVLFLIHLAGILAIFIIAARLFEIHPFGKNIAIFSLLLMGPIYAISSSQVKFVSGGVIGNTIGNLLIPFSLYFLFRGLQEKKTIFLSLSIFSVAGLAYTHHLSTLILIFIVAFSASIFAVLNIKNIQEISKEWLNLFLKPQILIILILFFLFFIFIYTPTYANFEAVGTAVGGPSKETRTGLTFNQLKSTAGEARIALGLVGIAILLFTKKRRSYENAFVLGWSISIILMSLRPDWLFLDLPSVRIANYVSFPLVIASSFALAYVMSQIKSSPEKHFLSHRIMSSFFLLIFTFILAGGYYDNSQSLNSNSNFQKAIQTFEASTYAAKNANSSNEVLKDHNYLTADSWIKLFFMGDYNYPLSRGLMKRYEDVTKPREMCTLWMISEPNNSNGQKCFADLGVNFIMVNPIYDSAQFQKSPEFWQVYSGNEISIYYRNK